VDDQSVRRSHSRPPQLPAERSEAKRSSAARSATAPTGSQDCGSLSPKMRQPFS